MVADDQTFHFEVVARTRGRNTGGHMKSSNTVVVWAPRLLGIGTALFLSVFALDAFGEGRGFWSALVPFLVHLWPACLLLVIVALAWRRAWIGSVLFLALAALYTILVAGARHHWDWMLLIGGPLAAVGALYLVAWFTARNQE